MGRSDPLGEGDRNFLKGASRAAKRLDGDFFETPAWVTRAIVPLLPASDTVFDPCAGKGALLRALPHIDRQGLELNAERAAFACSDDGGALNVICADALVCDWNHPHLVVMNPPFSKAQEFVEAALDRVERGGAVFALLRLGFVAGLRRVAFHRSNPADVYVLPRRPSFTGDGKTDGSEYAWFAFGPGRGGRWSVLSVQGMPS